MKTTVFDCEEADMLPANYSKEHEGQNDKWCF